MQRITKIYKCHRCNGTGITVKGTERLTCDLCNGTKTHRVILENNLAVPLPIKPININPIDQEIELARYTSGLEKYTDYLSKIVNTLEETNEEMMHYLITAYKHGFDPTNLKVRVKKYQDHFDAQKSEL